MYFPFYCIFNLEGFYLEIDRIFLDGNNEIEAKKMSAYMRNQFKFLGIKSPIRKKLQKEIFKEIIKPKEIDRNFVVEFFEKEYREFQYMVIDYLIKQKNFLVEKDKFLIRNLITNKSWWDTVDIISSNLLGHICKKYPNIVNEHILSWINDENMWIRRSSIIFQLRYKEDTNLEVLSKAIKDNLSDDDFFIKKAIGWALREYSKTNSDWVENFISENKLSSLSVKEAEKYIKKR